MPSRRFPSLAAVAVVAAAGGVLAGGERLARWLDPELESAERLHQVNADCDARLALVAERDQFKRRLVRELVAGAARLPDAAAELRRAVEHDEGFRVSLAAQFPSAPEGGREAAHLAVLVGLEADGDPARRRVVLAPVLDQYRAVYGDPAEVAAAIDRLTTPAPDPRPYRGGRWAGRGGQRPPRS